MAAASCGNSATAGPVGSPQAIIASAPDITLGQGSAQVIINSPHASATGAISLGSHDAQLTVRVNGNPDTSVVITDGTGYARTSPTGRFQTLPGPLPLEALINPSLSPTQDGSEDVLPSSDPWADIDLVRGAGHILSDGGGEIDGTSTIGYTVTIDPARAVAATPVARQAALKALLAGRTTPFMIQVSIDSAFRIRQVEVGANLTAADFKGESPPTRVDGETIGTDVDFVRFGVPMPAITVPQT
jgi:hypothetical protein